MVSLEKLFPLVDALVGAADSKERAW